MTLSTKSTTTSELPLRCCTTTLTMAYHHSHSRMLYLLPLLFLLLPHPCITAASWIIASLDYHCLFGPQPLFGLPRYFWITAVSTYQTKQSVTPISAFLVIFSFIVPIFIYFSTLVENVRRSHSGWLSILTFKGMVSWTILPFGIMLLFLWIKTTIAIFWKNISIYLKV